MKKWFFLLTALLIYQKWDVIDAYLNPAADTMIARNGEVILYATTWCGYCNATRELLAREGIPYTEYDIEKSAEGKQQYDSLRGRGVPLLVIDGEVIRGYNPQRILELAGRDAG